MLVDAAGLSTEQSISGRRARWTVACAVARRPGLRRIVLRMVANHPERLPTDLSHRILRGTGKAGFLPALACLPQAGIRGVR